MPLIKVHLQPKLNAPKIFGCRKSKIQQDHAKRRSGSEARSARASPHSEQDGGIDRPGKIEIEGFHFSANEPYRIPV